MNNLCVGLILTIVCLMQFSRLECAQPAVYYANVGSAANMPCTSGGGSFACFSTYAFQNQVFRMVYLNTTAKYQVMPGSVTVNNVQPTDAGFYACSNDCFQMKLDQISYYLQPMCKRRFFLLLQVLFNRQLKWIRFFFKFLFIYVKLMVNRQTWANSFLLFLHL